MNYDNIINNILTNKNTVFRTEHGIGRTVYLIDNLAIKIPRNNSRDTRSGICQSKLEYEIYSKEKLNMLCPVLYYNNGIVIMKRVESNPDILMNLVPRDLTFKELIFKLYGKEICYLADIYNLNMIDLVNIANWGYDTELSKFVCIDYGYKNNTEKMNLF